MGALTRDEIVNEGQLRGGRDDLNTVLNVVLADWLDRAGRSWMWPQLTQRRSNIAVGAGVSSITIGNNVGGIVQRVTRLITQPWLYDSQRTTRTRLAFRSITDEPSDILDPVTTTGMPSLVTVETPNQDQLKLTFNVVTDKDYLLFLVTHELPARPTTGSAVPWYPEDETMLQLIEAETLRRENGVADPSYQAALANLTDMMSTDKTRHGQNQSSNALWELDKGVYR